MGMMQKFCVLNDRLLHHQFSATFDPHIFKSPPKAFGDFYFDCIFAQRLDTNIVINSLMP